MAGGKRRRAARHAALGGALCCAAAALAPVGAPLCARSAFVAGVPQRRSASSSAGWRGRGAADELPPHARRLFGGPGGQPGRPNPYGGGGGGPGLQEPPWLGTAFFAAIILSFIPGPWQIILSPIISIINLFYMFKFGIFLLAIAAVFGLQWYFENTTLSAGCPNCGNAMLGPKGEPFQCGFCGTMLEAKDDAFIPYFKSGQAEKTPFETMQDFAQQAAKTASEAAPTESTVVGKTGGPSRPGGRPGKKPGQVVDVEVL